MASRKTRLLFVALFALAFGTLSGSAYAGMITVPKDECPSSFETPPLTRCEPINPLDVKCTRNDFDIEITDYGQIRTVEGESFTATNCVGCPENDPGPANRIAYLNVGYTEVVTATVDNIL